MLDHEIRTLERRAAEAPGCYWSSMRLAHALARVGVVRAPVLTAADLDMIYVHATFDRECEVEYHHWAVMDENGVEHVYYPAHADGRNSAFFDPSGHPEGEMAEWFGPVVRETRHAANRLRTIRAQARG